VTACPTSAIVLLAGGAKQTLRVPDTNADFETNVPGVFIVGELGGLGLIKTAINEGCQVAETIRKRLKADSAEIKADGCFEAIIVGAGPSGLSAALSFHRMGISYLALEQGEIASTVRNYPRKKFLMEEPVQVPLFGKLMMQDCSKEDLLAVWDRIVNETGVKVSTNQRVESVERADENALLIVRTSQGTYQGKYVILATGKRGSPRKLDVPGEDLSKVTYRLIEAESYTDCDVAVAGGGDSAVEAALALTKVGTNRVTLIHRRSDFSRLRDRNRSKLEEAEKTGTLTVIRNAQIREITSSALTVETPKGVATVKNDYIFVLVGGESPDAFLQKIGVQFIERVIAA
jgi:putative YpdA family bacillithiol system oxidoreductase